MTSFVNNELFSIIINNLGIVGFIVFLMFLLIAIIKNDSQKKILIYVFSLLAIVAVTSTIYFQQTKTDAIKENNNSGAIQIFENTNINGSVIQHTQITHQSRSNE